MKLIDLGIFNAVADLAVGAKRRRDQEHADFLAFFRTLVETVPTEAAALFGNMHGVKVRLAGKDESFSIELTATDFMWWKGKIENDGARLLAGPASVQSDMLNHFARMAETYKLGPEDRKKLIALLDPKAA